MRRELSRRVKSSHLQRERRGEIGSGGSSAHRTEGNGSSVCKQGRHGEEEVMVEFFWISWSILLYRNLDHRMDVFRLLGDECPGRLEARVRCLGLKERFGKG